MSRVTPGERLYLTADGSQIVKHGDVRAASLYCSEYGEVDEGVMKSLLKEDKRPVSDKSEKAVTENKSRKRK